LKAPARKGSIYATLASFSRRRHGIGHARHVFARVVERGGEAHEPVAHGRLNACVDEVLMKRPGSGVAHGDDPGGAGGTGRTVARQVLRR